MPSRVDKGPGKSTFTAFDVSAYATTRYGGATVVRIAFLTNGALRATRGHGENLPDDTLLCLLTLHGEFAHSVPPVLATCAIRTDFLAVTSVECQDPAADGASRYGIRLSSPG